MWRPDAKICGHEILRIQELASPVLVGWVLVTTDRESGPYRVVHRNGLQTNWHDDPDQAIIEAFGIQKEYLVIRKKTRRRRMFKILRKWLWG